MTTVERAVAWLTERKFVLGVDFTMESAVVKANEVAFDEEVARMKASGGFIGFDGANCDEPCSGWDMESRRCDCGNRRVDWTSGMSHSFERPCVYAEAY